MIFCLSNNLRQHESGLRQEGEGWPLTAICAGMTEKAAAQSKRQCSLLLNAGVLQSIQQRDTTTFMSRLWSVSSARL